MDITKLTEGALGRIDPRLATGAYSVLKRLPFVRRLVEREFDSMLGDIGDSVRPYSGKTETYRRLPVEGRSREELLDLMGELQAQEADRWRDGYVSGAVYHGDARHIEFLNRVYAINSQANPLHADLWPSTLKYEAEVISMTAQMLGAGEAVNDDGAPAEVCGSVSSGGTESILLAMKAYRDRARAQRRVRHPEMVAPVTAHAAFDKAAEYFNIKMVKVPIGASYKADVAEARKAINRNTVVVVGSAPCFPHGIIDPIADLSELARARGVGFHTDACLGGFVLPWAERLGYPVPWFDFRLPGVTSISADTHKYGYAAKGTSVVLYRDPALRRFQYYTTTDWPGGLYFSPTFAGSRPGALSAACWAALVSIGEAGYLDATHKILETAASIKQGLREIPEIEILGEPLWVIAFASEEVDIYRVMDHMTERGWSLNGLHKPSCVHLCVTLRHTQAGVAERFVSDLKEAVAHVKSQPKAEGGMAPVYGLAAQIPVRTVVGELLERYIDLMYEIDPE